MVADSRAQAEDALELIGIDMGGTPGHRLDRCGGRARCGAAPTAELAGNLGLDHALQAGEPNAAFASGGRCCRA